MDLRLEYFDVGAGREDQIFRGDLAVDIDVLTLDRLGLAMDVGGHGQSRR